MSLRARSAAARKGWPVPWSKEPWSKALVYGLGLSGKAAAELLLNRGVEVVAVDRRPREQLDLGALEEREGLTILPESEARGLPEGVDGVVISPGVPPDRPLLADAAARGIPVLAEVELAFPLLDGPVLAITGSNGKSTTTALTGALLADAGYQVEVAGNIGRPLASCVEGPRSRLYVVELSSFQLEATFTFRPRAAALLNLSPDHLDRYSGMAAYGQAKARIFANQGPADLAVLNADDPWVAALRTPAPARTFSRLRKVADGCYLEGDQVVEVSPGSPPHALFTLADLPLPGVHNLENAMAAVLLARSLDVPQQALAQALRSFRGLPHRTEKVAEAGGVSWWDDSKGTNPAATAKSLEGFTDGTVHLILGGRNKGADFGELRDIVRRKARHLYLIGEAAAEIDTALNALAPGSRSETLEAAVDEAASRAQPGEVVLLSPACASFDQYKSFIERGQHFQNLVRGHVGEGRGVAANG